MCGRYANSEDPEIQAAFFLAKITAKKFHWRKTWNAAPSQAHPIVKMEDHTRVLELARWGWSRTFGKNQFLVNARGEEAATKKTWAEALCRARCLVPATAFYEWEESTGQPHAFRLQDGSLFGIAGLYEQTEDGCNYILLTTSANRLVVPVHHRMACIIPPELHESWLNPQTPLVHVQELIKAYPPERMASSRIGSGVNSVKNDGPELLNPNQVSSQLRIDGI